MSDQIKKETHHFQFPITPFLQKKLNGISKQANPDGEKIVRWTDIILAGLNKLTPEDLVRLRREREAFLNHWQKAEQHEQIV